MYLVIYLKFLQYKNMSDSIYIIQAFQKGIIPTKITTFRIFNMDSYALTCVPNIKKNIEKQYKVNFSRTKSFNFINHLCDFFR